MEETRNFTRRPARLGHYDNDDKDIDRIRNSQGRLPRFDSFQIEEGRSSSPGGRLSNGAKKRSSKKVRDIVVDPEQSGRRRSSTRASGGGDRRASLKEGEKVDVDDDDDDDDKTKEGEEEELVTFVLEEFVDDRNPGLGKQVWSGCMFECIRKCNMFLKLRMTHTQVVEEQWSANHSKLLYLVSKYAICARTAADEEGWIRSLPLIVLMYEGIVAGCLDFDYAPASTLISMVGKQQNTYMQWLALFNPVLLTFVSAFYYCRMVNQEEFGSM